MKGIKKPLAAKIAESLHSILNAQQAGLGDKMQKLNTNAAKKLAAKYVKQMQKLAKAEKKAAAKNAEAPTAKAPKVAKTKAVAATPAPKKEKATTEKKS